ncbi:MAG TPA: hypothetical protein VN634_00965 [Candidatus Limnocylindrales bacterium]|nr:hypothetical protein [Candidatus Limnocylindrales bacterium]
MRLGSLLLIAGSILAAPPVLAASDIPKADCERETKWFAQVAEKTEVVHVTENRRTETAADGKPHEVVEIRWNAMGQEFVVDLDVGTDPATDKDGKPLRQMFSGKWRGKDAQSVLFWRLPSGQWEGDLKLPRDLYSIRSNCRDAPETTIFYYQKYPENPEV